MKSFFAILIICCSFILHKAYAQTVDPKLLEELKKKAAALQKLDRNAIKKDPQAALKQINQYLKTTDSVTKKIKDNALQNAPNKELVKKYMNLPKDGDTTYTAMQFTGTIDQTINKRHIHIKVACTSKQAPLVRNGSTFSVLMDAGGQFSSQAAIIKNKKVQGALATYILNQNTLSGRGSYSNIEHIQQDLDGRTFYSNSIANGTTTANALQEFVFGFDTLSHIGQAAFFKGMAVHLSQDYDSLISNGTTQTMQHLTNNTEYSIMTGVGAATDASTYDFKALNQDPGYATLNAITDGKMLSVPKATDDGKPKAILIINKTPYGFQFACNYDNNDHGNVTSIHIRGFVGRPPMDYEAVILPDVPLQDSKKITYEHWLPKGSKVTGGDDTKAGDSLSFYVVLRSKKDPTKLYHNYTVNWNLDEVTKYPGICNNYPKFTENPNIDADLKFSDDLKNDDNFDIGSISANSANSKTSKGEFAKVKVMSMDYAAWGKLFATVILDNGDIIEGVAPYYDENKNYATVPFDKDDNYLADRWEDSIGILHAGHALTWDEDDKPKEQRDQGDGYTLFEEYRGFAVHKPKETAPDKQDVFERTDPTIKDAFVYDKDNLFKDNYEADNPSNLNWHYLSFDKNQLLFYPDPKDIEKDLNRLVNFNKVPEYFYSEQYCLFIEYSNAHYNYDAEMTACSFTKAEWDYANTAHPTHADTLAYEAGTTKEYTTKSPMKRFLKIDIFKNMIISQYQFVGLRDGPITFESAIKIKIADAVKHEIGHCLGIHHHIAPSGATQTDLHDELGAKENDGTVDCLMRYYTKEEKHDLKVILVPRKKYCKKGETGPCYYIVHTGTADSAGDEINTEPILPGVTHGDNCYGQITVRSKPGE